MANAANTQIPATMPSTQTVPTTTPTPPNTSPPSGKRMIILVIVGTAFLVVIVIAAIVMMSQAGKKTTGKTSATTAVSPSPGAAKKFVSQTYNYSLTYPAGWDEVDVVEYRTKSFGPTDQNLTEIQKKNLDEYYSFVDAMFRNENSTLTFKPRIIVRVINSGGGGLSGEVANHKEYLANTYTNVVFDKESSVQFQNIDAYTLERIGDLGSNRLHGKELIFVRGNRVFSIAIITLDDDWQNNYDKLFEGVANSFSLQ